MNILLKIGLNGLTDTLGNELRFDSESVNLFLDPYYATEEDVIRVFADEIGPYRMAIQKIIFEGSLVIDRKLNQKVVQALNLPETEIFAIKRQYVICYAVYEFSKVFFRDYTKSYSKQKFLADFKVSMEVDKDPHFIKQIGQDAKLCMEEIEQVAQDAGGFNMRSFVLGQNNPANAGADRRWFPSINNNGPQISIAANKVQAFNTRYKIGI